MQSIYGQDFPQDVKSVRRWRGIGVFDELPRLCREESEFGRRALCILHVSGQNETWLDQVGEKQTMWTGQTTLGVSLLFKIIECLKQTQNQIIQMIHILIHVSPFARYECTIENVLRLRQVPFIGRSLEVLGAAAFKIGSLFPRFDLPVGHFFFFF